MYCREEAMSLVVLEAVSRGLYTITTRVSGNKDVIRDNESKVIDKITSGLPTMVIVDDNTIYHNKCIVAAN